MFTVVRRLLRHTPRWAPPHGAARAVAGSAQQRSRDAGPPPSDDAVAEAEVVASSTPADGGGGAAGGFRRMPAPPRPAAPVLTEPVVLDSVEDSVVVAATEQVVDGRRLWTGTKVLRANKHVRRSSAACVVGGASAIQRVWRRYKVRPNVVYVPNTEAAVPAWCLEAALPTVLVRSSPVAVRQQLLSAEYSDGYAAEFPLPPQCVSDATALLAPPPSGPRTPDPSAPPPPADPAPARPLHDPLGYHAVKAMLVLVGLRIPSNVGALLRAAVDMGYDAAVLVNCADPMQEKVLRASDGTALSPALRLYETEASEQACVSLLSSIAAQHHLLPLLAVPSQEVEPAFEVAKRFHVYNAAHQAREDGAATTRGDGGGGAGTTGSLRAPPPPQLGAMVVLGSEAQGLRDLHGRWAVPYQFVTLPLPNPMVDSYNVSVAGSVLLDLFRPGAAAHFTRLVELSGEAVADLLPKPTAASVGGDDDGEDEDDEMEKDGLP